MEKVIEFCKKYHLPEAAYIAAFEKKVMPPMFAFPSEKAEAEFAEILKGAK